MVNTIRVIPRLDIKGPNLIKGIQFDGHRVLGVPEEFSSIYYHNGADELIYYDSVASLYGRNNLLKIVSETANKSFIPLTVAGGIRTIDDIHKLLRAGADKVAINTSAVKNPKWISEAVAVFGSQCIVSSIETYKTTFNKYFVWTDYGRETTSLDAMDWAKYVEQLGVGEILLTSINQEGMGKGFDLELIHQISNLVSIPVIACGGCGCPDDLVAAVEAGADAVAAASCFHYFYALENKVDCLDVTTTMQFNESRLRMGEQIDAGNIDFLNNGYGGQQAVLVSPCSIIEAKQAMVNQGIKVRL